MPNFDAGNFEQNMILSEVDVISFVKMECPENYASIAEEEGAMTVTDDDGDVSKTTAVTAVSY